MLSIKVLLHLCPPSDKSGNSELSTIQVNYCKFKYTKVPLLAAANIEDVKKLKYTKNTRKKLKLYFLP